MCSMKRFNRDFKTQRAHPLGRAPLQQLSLNHNSIIRHSLGHDISTVRLSFEGRTDKERRATLSLHPVRCVPNLRSNGGDSRSRVLHVSKDVESLDMDFRSRRLPVCCQDFLATAAAAAQTKIMTSSSL